MDPQEIAAELRTRAFNLMLAADDDGASVPFGFINEFRQGETVVTLAAFRTGDVSLYFSTGGGVLGGVGRPELASLARSGIAELGPVVSQLTRSDDIEPPAPGEFTYYLLTRGGRYAARAKATDSVARDGAIVRMVRLGGALITKLRESSKEGPRAQPGGTANS